MRYVKRIEECKTYRVNILQSVAKGYRIYLAHVIKILIVTLSIKVMKVQCTWYIHADVQKCI